MKLRFMFSVIRSLTVLKSPALMATQNFDFSGVLRFTYPPVRAGAEADCVAISQIRLFPWL